MKNFDAIIIGGGAFGLMCAVQSGFLGKRVLILEKNKTLGEKIRISGGGRCNYTNLYTDFDKYRSKNEHFTKSALSQWTVEDTINFFEMYGIKPQEKTLGQIFPESNKASDFVKVLKNLCKELEHQIETEVDVVRVEKHENVFTIFAQKNAVNVEYSVEKIVVASGGLAIPKMGATGIGLQIARNFGLSIVPTAPALVPLVVTGKEEQWYEQLSGNSFWARVSNAYRSFEENILFTHWGLSGPAILQISTYWQQGEVININLLPNDNIISLLEVERKNNGKKLLASFLIHLFSRRFVETLDDILPIEKNVASLTKDDMLSIERFIHHFQFVPASDKGYDKAEVMRGGIDTNELNSKTLEAKKVSGLYFGGECVDVTGWLGGYNFQWAWACGFVVAKNI